MLAQRPCMRGSAARLVLAALGLMLVVFPATAQSRLRLGVSAGAAVPVGRFGDQNDPGLSAGAHLLLTSPFFPQDLKFEVQHNRMKLADSDARTLVTSATLNLELNPSSARARVAPYISGGAGGYYVKTQFTSGYDDVTKFGWNAGGGIRFAIPGINAFLDARHHWVRSHGPAFRSKVRYVPIVFGVTL